MRLGILDAPGLLIAGAGLSVIPDLIRDRHDAIVDFINRIRIPRLIDEGCLVESGVDHSLPGSESVFVVFCRPAEIFFSPDSGRP